MNSKSISKPVTVLIVNILAFFVAKYVSILSHEWFGHGLVAWLCGVKNSPFDIQYGGWMLTHVDEHVNYALLLQSGKGVQAALIGVAGSTVNLIYLLLSLFFLSKKSIQSSSAKFIFAYWFLVISLIPLIQYLAVSTFSSQGDIGRFIYGLNISPWWVFILGTIFNIWCISRVLRLEIIRAYVYMPVKSLIAQHILLLVTLGTIFLFIYSGGYNPLTDPGVVMLDKILAAITMLLVPILFFICSPARDWVKRKVKIISQK